MSRANRATAAAWRAACSSRMSSERIRPASTPHDSDDVLLGAVARLLEQVRHVREREHAGEREGDPAVPTLSVMLTPATATRMLKPALGRNSTSVLRPYCSAVGNAKRRRVENMPKLTSKATTPASTTAR